jgi:hypothetical protein
MRCMVMMGRKVALAEMAAIVEARHKAVVASKQGGMHDDSGSAS